MKNKKLIKNKCEIEGCDVIDASALHFHHIIGRKEIGTSNDPFNLAILCSVHHNLVHSGKIKIIGVYPSTKPPNHRMLIYELNGERNLDIDEPYCNFSPKHTKVFL